MSKAGAPTRKPFVRLQGVTVYVLSDNLDRIIAFKAVVDGEVIEAKVTDNILRAWLKVEAFLDKKTGDKIRKGLASKAKLKRT